MLTKIREKSQGAFAGVILTAICVPFVLWGINNYINDGQEAPVASVGKKDFYQRDVTKAYEKYQQSLGGLAAGDEENIKLQALKKLIKDEVLLQYVNQKGLTVTDNTIRDFIQSLPYFQTDNKFDEQKYKQLLAQQRMSSGDFVGQIKNALIMEQFQQSILDSSFATPYDVDHFFKIQNQTRDVEYVTVPVTATNDTLSDSDIHTYYQAHQTQYQLPEQMSIEYIELTLEEIAKTVEVTDDKLRAFYDEQAAQYSTPERRKISHILFAINDAQDEKTALEKATQARALLATQDFASVAATHSDDKVTGKTGGDLGLLTAGVMDKEFETAALALKQGDVSAPVKSSFGYHLIKVTELTPAQVKPFESVKSQLTQAYQKSQAENTFYQQAESLTEVSYQNSDNLKVAAEQLNLTIKKTGLFTKSAGEGIAADEKIRSVAFSDEVINGTNSTPIELDAEHLVVLRVLEHKAAEDKPLEQVKAEVVKALQTQKAQQNAIDTAKAMKTKLLNGETLSKVAADYKLTVQKASGLTRMKKDFNVLLNDAIFKAAKPVGEKPSIFTVALPTHEQVVVNLTAVKEGAMTDDDKKRAALATKNIAKAIGDSEFNAVINTLEQRADIDVNLPSPAAQ